jgi:hypothetical protein
MTEKTVVHGFPVAEERAFVNAHLVETGGRGLRRRLVADGLELGLHRCRRLRREL